YVPDVIVLWGGISLFDGVPEDFPIAVVDAVLNEGFHAKGQLCGDGADAAARQRDPLERGVVVRVAGWSRVPNELARGGVPAPGVGVRRHVRGARGAVAVEDVQEQRRDPPDALGAAGVRVEVLLEARGFSVRAILGVAARELLGGVQPAVVGS